MALSGQIAFALNEGDRYKIQLKIKRYFLFILFFKNQFKRFVKK